MTTTISTSAATTSTLPPYTHELTWPEGMQPYKVIDEDGSQGLPYEHYAWLREHAPLVRSEAPGSDVWVITRYEDVRAAIRAPKIFSSQILTPPPLTFLTIHDAPNHNRLRKVVAGAFTPKSVGIMEDRIRERATQLMNGLLNNGGGDLVADYSLQLSMATISGILDVPADDQDLMKLWSDEIFTYFAQLARNAPGNDTAEKNTRDFLDYLLKNLERLYESESEAVGGHIARMWKAGELSDKEASELCSFMFVAGHDTTTILMTNAFWVLSQEPEVLARLREHPEDIDKFVEELARYRGAVHRTVRRVNEDTEVAGYTIPKGSIVRLMIASANHDAAKFENPEVFDIDRDNKGHFGFGHGVHSCVGAPLARLETRITTELIASMVGDLELDEEHDIALAHGSNISNGPTSLHMKLSAR